MVPLFTIQYLVITAIDCQPGKLSMKTEIEKIILADDRAFERVEAAREESRKIRARAEREAEDLLALKETESAEALSADIQSIISQSREKVAEIHGSTARYLERMRQRKNAASGELLALLLRKVTGA